MGGHEALPVSEAQQLFDPEPGWLNTASYGLPPRPAWEALQEALGDWRRGRTSWEGWDHATQRARESFARLVGADAGDIAVGSAVSQMVGLLAAALPDGARVLARGVEYGSNLFPYQMHESRGVVVQTVEVDDLVDRIDERVDLVAVSAVQSATGQAARIDLATTATSRRRSCFAIERGGISTITSPSGLTITPRRRASSTTRCPTRSSGSFESAVAICAMKSSRSRHRSGYSVNSSSN